MFHWEEEMEVGRWEKTQSDWPAPLGAKGSICIGVGNHHEMGPMPKLQFPTCGLWQAGGSLGAELYALEFQGLAPKLLSCVEM